MFFISRDLSFVLIYAFILLNPYAYLIFLTIIRFQNHPAQNFQGIPMIFQQILLLLRNVYATFLLQLL